MVVLSFVSLLPACETSDLVLVDKYRSALTNVMTLKCCIVMYSEFFVVHVDKTAIMLRMLLKLSQA